jgi:hypothetical protein
MVKNAEPKQKGRRQRMDMNETHDEDIKENVAVMWPYRRNGESK